ncbi:MAG: type II toxin-antitoxin system YafQ family toxin [Candidatus Aureabacteria bacterium]|nr:type II toxin-antitoxin system YafQ family toxin [Candidatus Auribacterota bacterium]
MLTLKTTSRFQKDYKKFVKSGRDMARLKQVMTWIANEQPLPPALRDHKLIGNYQGRRECHLAGDWLLIYKLEEETVIFERTGSHPELPRK